MRAGQTQMVQLRLTEPLPLVPGERYVLRCNLPGGAGLVTIGGGRFLGTTNTRLRRQKQWTLDFLQARRKSIDDPVLWCEQIARESGKPISAQDLQVKSGQRAEEFVEILKGLRAKGVLIETSSGLMVHRECVDATAAKLYEAIETFHKVNSQRAGIGKDELFAGLGMAPDMGELGLRQLLDKKRIEMAGTAFAKAGWSARLPENDQKLYDQINAAFLTARWAAPSLQELSTALHEPPLRVEKMIKLLTDRGLVIRLDSQLCIHKTALEAAKKIALQLFAKKPVFTTMEFRDALGVSRKYAVPLVDYLDRARFTVRNGNNRTPGVEARKLL